MILETYQESVCERRFECRVDNALCRVNSHSFNPFSVHFDCTGFLGRYHACKYYMICEYCKKYNVCGMSAYWAKGGVDHG